MTSTTVPVTASATAPASSPRLTAVAAGVVLVAFTAFSSWVIVREGYFGYLTLAGREPWAMQLLIDLVLSLVVANVWMTADAKKRGLTAWPFVLATPAVGSIAVLAYVVRRALAAERRP